MWRGMKLGAVAIFAGAKMPISETGSDAKDRSFEWFFQSIPDQAR